MVTPEESAGVARDPRTVAVIGAGYVGTPTAVLLAHFGHHVVLAERDDSRLASLRAGRCPVIEEGLDELLASTQRTGRLTLVGDAATAATGADVVFLCVATPGAADGHADLRQVDDAVEEIRDVLRDGAVVVNKSTVPVGTARRVEELLGRPAVRVVSNPEFLREGSAVRNSFSPDRTVIGANDEAAARLVADLFAPTGAPVVFTDPSTAELIKYAANAFLTTKLSFINAMAQLCDAVGGDVDTLVRGIGHDPRIGFSFLSPGPGWGGPCLPKDTSALLAMARDVGVDLATVRASLAANDAQRDHVVARIRTLAGGDLAGARVGVLGLTFKAHTDDRRDSPALDVARHLVADGATVTAFDPTVGVGEVADDLTDVALAASALDACRGARVVVVLTEWPAFASLDFGALGAVVGAKVLYDTRGVVDAAAARDHGFTLERLGRP